MFANFHLKDFMLLECYVLRKNSFENFILLEDVGLMTFCILWKVLCHWEIFDFMKLI